MTTVVTVTLWWRCPDSARFNDDYVTNIMTTQHGCKMTNTTLPWQQHHKQHPDSHPINAFMTATPQLLLSQQWDEHRDNKIQWQMWHYRCYYSSYINKYYDNSAMTKTMMTNTMTTTVLRQILLQQCYDKYYDDKYYNKSAMTNFMMTNTITTVLWQILWWQIL